MLLEQGPVAHSRLSVPQTWRLPRQMGLAAQVPVHRAAERDEQAVAAWAEEVWPVVERR
nr:winged helix-turn-helix domain-containing protein [Streptomyces sp. alain-838]